MSGWDEDGVAGVGLVFVLLFRLAVFASFIGGLVAFWKFVL